MAKTIVALYDDVNHAQMAVRDLVDTGVDRDHISLMANNATRTGEFGTTPTTDLGGAPVTGETSGAAEGAGVGAGIGAALGGIGGLLVGLGALAIPGIGPVIAAGPLAAALGGVAGAGAGAIAGGATGGLIGALTDMGVGEEQAGYYAEGIRRGGTLLTVRTDDQVAPRAVDIMNRHHPIDIKERVSAWRESGWSTFDVNAGPYAGTGTTSRDFDRSSGMGSTGTGYGSGTSTEYSSTDRGIGSSGMGEGSLSSDRPDPALRDHDLSGTSSTGYTPTGELDDSSTIRGEQSSTTHVERSTIDQPDDQINYTTNMGAAANIGSTGGTTGTGYSSGMGSGLSGSRTFDTYENDFRSHFDTHYANRGYTYNQYMPAYRFGYDLSGNERYSGRDWNEIETDIRHDWESRYPDNAWEDFKDAVRHSWQRVKDVFD